MQGEVLSLASLQTRRGSGGSQDQDLAEQTKVSSTQRMSLLGPQLSISPLQKPSSETRGRTMGLSQPAHCKDMSFFVHSELS